MAVKRQTHRHTHQDNEIEVERQRLTFPFPVELKEKNNVGTLLGVVAIMLSIFEPEHKDKQMMEEEILCHRL